MDHQEIESMTRIGLVGTGFMGQTHVDRYTNISDAEVTAVASLNDSQEFIDKNDLNAQAYDGGLELISDADVDAVDICTPTNTHPELVIAAAESELDMFCEKPVANSLADAKQMADAVADSSTSCMVGHVLRYFPEYAAMHRQVVEEEAIGQLGVARARRISPFPEWCWEGWYGDDDKSGGVLLDLAIHDLDYLRWTFGDVDQVFARRTKWEDRQQAHVTLRFESGAVGYVESGWALPDDAGLSSELELAGEDGLIEYDSSESSPLEFQIETESSVSPITVEKDGYHRELEAFVDCVQTGDEPPIDISEGIAAIRLSLAAIESVDRGEPVTVSEVSL